MSPHADTAVPPLHAVLWIDHHSARLLQFDTEHVTVQKVQAHTHDTGHHGSSVRTEQEFYGEVCDELAAIAEIVVAGSPTALSAFREYVEKHRIQLAPLVVAWQTASHPTEAQLVALARQYFVKPASRAGPRPAA